MLDNQLFQLIIPIISASLIADGVTGIPVIQAYQPTQQGEPLAPAVYIAKLSDYGYGWVESQRTIDTIVETQQQETTFRIESSVIQNPLTPDALTASDVTNKVAMILRSQTTIKALASVGVGILRITDISNNYETDDRNQFEAFPAFNFILSHKLTRTTLIPVVQSTESLLARV